MVTKAKDNDGSHLAGITLEGDDAVAPDNVLSSEAAARQFYQDLALDHTTRFKEYAKINRQYQGYRPRDAKKLQEQGLGYLSNVNNGHARIYINRYLASEYNLIHAVASPIKATVRLFPDKRINHRIAKAFERAFKDTYPTWPDYYTHLDSMRKDRALYGIGIIMREFDAKAEGTSWRFKTVCPEQFLCPLQTGIEQDSLAKFCILHSKTVQELWDIYENLTDKSNWDEDALAHTLWYASQRSINRSGSEETSWRSELLEYQKKRRNYDLSVTSTYEDDVPLVSVYTKEFDGSWTHTIIHESHHTSKPLFFKSNAYAKLNEFMQIFAYETGEKTIHAVRGLGYKIFQPVEVQNRLDNVLIDQAHISSTVLIRTRQGRGKDAKSVKINLGAFNDVGEAEFVQQLSAGNLQSSLSVNQYQAQILERNVQFEGDNGNPADPDPSAYRSLGEVGLIATRDAVLTRPQVSFFYRQLDLFLQDTVRLIYMRKADEFFEEFKTLVEQEISDLQLPPEVIEALFTYPTKDSQLNRHGLPLWLKITAARSTSSGSQVADILAANRLFPLAQFMGTEERYTYLQVATAAYSDHDNVDLFFPDKNRPQVIKNAQQKAAIENAVLTLGKEVPVSPNDDHREEAPVHLSEAQRIVQSWIEGGDPITADDQLRILYPHFLAHYTLLSQDPLSKAVFEGLAPMRGEVENQFRQIQANAANARLAIQRREEQRRLELAQQQLRADPNSPENLKILVDHELETRDQNMKEARALRSENLNAIKSQVKSNLETNLMVRKFKNNEIRENIKLQKDLNAPQQNNPRKS
jgi:hypothetical protein